MNKISEVKTLELDADSQLTTYCYKQEKLFNHLQSKYELLKTAMARKYVDENHILI